MDRTVRVWKVHYSEPNSYRGELLCSLEGHVDSVYSVAISPDESFIVSASLDKTLRLWHRPASSALYRFAESVVVHKDFCLSVCISPDSRWIASGSKDRTIQIGEVLKDDADIKYQHQLVIQGHRNSVISVAFSKDMLLASGSGDFRARLWALAEPASKCVEGSAAI